MAQRSITTFGILGLLTGALTAAIIHAEPPASPPSPPTSPPANPVPPDAPVLTATIPLPEITGRIDHLAYDSATGHLFIAALGCDALEVIDTAARTHLARIDHLLEPQGVAVISDLHRVYVACGGDGTIRSLDSQSLQEMGHIEVGADADNLRFDAAHHLLLAGAGEGQLVALNPADLTIAFSVALPGHPESFQIDPAANRAYINVPSSSSSHSGSGGSILVADLTSHSITATWPMKEAQANYPLALDAAHGWVFVACRRPARLLLFEAPMDGGVGREIARGGCVGDADDLFVDASTGHVLIIGGEGKVDVFGVEEEKHLIRLASVTTAPGARTGLFVPETRTLFIAAPARGGEGARLLVYSVP